MSNKTFIPAFQCSVGDWKYYICMMKYAEVARQVSFAYELGGHTELGQLIQRGISSRTKGITEYLLKSQHRFLGALVLAAWGGEPNYTPMQMDDPDGMLRGIDREFGVLTFDGTQAYFALDGQHRLRAIKDAIKQNPELGKEDICVLIVTHYDTAQGRLRTRRLFTNINKNAKQTGTAENIALDEDNTYAILTRRMLDEHPFLHEDGRVRVILSTTEDGEVKLASGSVPKTDARALTTITVLYDVLQYLGWDLPAAANTPTVRPSDEVLDACSKTLTQRVDDLLVACGGVRARLEEALSAREVRAPKTDEGLGHPFMRPVVQKAVARVAREIMLQRLLTWEELLSRLSELEWRMHSAPWQAVFSDDGRMMTGKENTTLLAELLKVHLAPTTLQEIRRARKAFKELNRGVNYPVEEAVLAARLQTTEAPAPVPEIPLPKEISTDQDGDAAQLLAAAAATIQVTDAASPASAAQVEELVASQSEANKDDEPRSI